MKTIVVDDEEIMLNSFVRNSKDVAGINIVGKFDSSTDALEYVKSHEVELVISDIHMPVMNGIALAKEIRKLRPDVLIVFITAYGEYIQESNEINADYYIVKPYRRDTIEQMAERMMLLSGRLKKNVRLQMFGRFVVYKDGKPLPLRGKAKEILALVATRRGKEMSNEEIYSTIWEDREYDNDKMKVYYNALKRLKLALESEGLSELLISTTRGQIFNTKLVDCDYYSWMDKNAGLEERFDGEFLSEYSWGEYLIGELFDNM